MSKNLSTNSKLLVISDTGMYEQDGKVYAFRPVVQELEYFLQTFDSITWIGFNRLDQKNNKAYKEVSSKAIRLIPLKQVGGRGVFSKIKVLYQYPKMLY